MYITSGSPGGSAVKESACSVGDARDMGSIPGLGRSPEQEMATHYSILAWKISWTGEPGGLQSLGSQRFGHDWSDWWRKQWYPTPVLLPGKSHRWRSLVGCGPWGHEESDTAERLHFHFSLHALEKEMATHSSVLAWRIPGMAEPGGLPSMGSHRVGHDWSDLAAAAAAEVTEHV